MHRHFSGLPAIHLATGISGATHNIRHRVLISGCTPSISMFHMFPLPSAQVSRPSRRIILPASTVSPEDSASHYITALRKRNTESPATTHNSWQFPAPIYVPVPAAVILPSPMVSLCRSQVMHQMKAKNRHHKDTAITSDCDYCCYRKCRRHIVFSPCNIRTDPKQEHYPCP